MELALYILLAACVVFRAFVPTVNADFSSTSMSKFFGHCVVFFVFGYVAASQPIDYWLLAVACGASFFELFMFLTFKPRK